MENFEMEVENEPSSPINMENQMETSSTPDMDEQVENISEIETLKLETTTKVEMENASITNPSTQNNVEKQVEKHSAPSMENPTPPLETTKVESMEEMERKETPIEVEETSSKESSKVESVEIESPIVKNSTPVDGEVKTPAGNNSFNMEMEKKKTTKVEKSPVDVERNKVEVDPLEWALSYRKEYGELPGRKKLIEGSKCTEWQARKTLTQLKKLKKAN